MINELVDKLHTDKTKLRFLRKLYKPGNIEVADAIIALDSTNTFTPGQEADHALANEQEERFEQMAKKYVDASINKDTMNFTSTISSWGDPEIAKYAIGKLGANRLYAAITIAKDFGWEDKREYLAREQLRLALEKGANNEFHGSSLARLALDLGENDQAINLYLKAGSTYSALNTAKEHKPERVKEIANIEFKEFGSLPSFYLECAKIIDKEDEAKRKIVEFAREIASNPNSKLYSDIRYENLIETLVSIDEIGYAVSVVESLEKICSKQDSDIKITNTQLPELYSMVGNQEKSKELILNMLDYAIDHFRDPHDGLNFVGRAKRLGINDNEVKEREMVLWEKGMFFEDASKIAIELGKEDLASAYLQMEELLQAKKQIEKNHQNNLL